MRELEVSILHLQNLDHVEVFTWTTKKKGATSQVASYILDKFNHEPPKDYTHRKLKTNDRIILKNKETKQVNIYEVVYSTTVTQV